MAYTRHGHQITGTPDEGGVARQVIGCEGPPSCLACEADAARARHAFYMDSLTVREGHLVRVRDRITQAHPSLAKEVLHKMTMIGASPDRIDKAFDEVEREIRDSAVRGDT